MRTVFGFVAAALAAAILAGPAPADAWSRQGHVVAAQIAFDDLAAHDPAVIDRIVEIAKAQPDHGAFEVAVGRATGRERARRVFLEMARWPDDTRGTTFDHPTWHYAERAWVDPNHAPPSPPPQRLSGAALDALAVNLNVARDPLATPSERAVALCWLFHVLPDIHQPLHAAQLFSARFPAGDQGGGKQFVRDPWSGETESLHWYWDDVVNRLDDPAAIQARAAELEARLPRSGLAELSAARPDDFAAFAAESYSLAGSLAYRADVLAITTETEAQAVVPPAAYVADSKAAAERRPTLSGYRLADLMREVFGR